MVKISTGKAHAGAYQRGFLLAGKLQILHYMAVSTVIEHDKQYAIL